MSVAGPGQEIPASGKELARQLHGLLQKSGIFKVFIAARDNYFVIWFIHWIRVAWHEDTCWVTVRAPWVEKTWPLCIRDCCLVNQSPGLGGGGVAQNFFFTLKNLPFCPKTP